MNCRILINWIDISGLATLVNDIAIISGDKVVEAGNVGEVWLKGPNVMKGYWNDPGTVLEKLTIRLNSDVS